jgi:ferrous iron transport protein A
MENNISLADLRPGNKAIVDQIIGGRNLRQKLVNLGMLPGTEVTVVRSNKLGPMVLNIHNSRIMIGAGMAKKIYVRQK